MPEYKQDDVIKALEAAIASKTAVICYDVHGKVFKGTPNPKLIQVSLEEVERNKDSNGKLVSYTLRFSYLNPYAADPGKKHLKTGRTETLHIKQNEAGHLGAHLLIGLVEESGAKQGLAKCVLEHVQGLSRSKIMNLIEVVADKHMSAIDRPEYTYREKENGKKRDVTAVALLKLYAFPEKSSSLEDDLNNKILSHVTFIGDPDATDNLDVDGISGIQKSIAIKIEDKYGVGQKARNLLESLKAHATQRRFKLKGQFDEDIDGEIKSVTREIDVDTVGFADQLFSQKTNIHVKKNLPAAYENIDSDVVKELSKLMDDKSYWA